MHRIIRAVDVSEEDRAGGAYSIKRMGTFTLKNPSTLGVYQTTIPQGSKVSNHFHDGLEEVLFFMSPAGIRVEETDYRVQPGDLVYLPRGTPHEISAPDNDVTLLALKLPENPHDKTLVH